MESSSSGTQIPLVRKDVIEEWADKYDIIRGVSPRWLIPTVVHKTDSLILVSDVMKETSMGLGLKSNLEPLNENEIALSSDLLSKSGKRVGDKIEIKLSIKDLFNGRKLI